MHSSCQGISVWEKPMQPRVANLLVGCWWLAGWLQLHVRGRNSTSDLLADRPESGSRPRSSATHRGSASTLASAPCAAATRPSSILPHLLRGDARMRHGRRPVPTAGSCGRGGARRAGVCARCGIIDVCEWMLPMVFWMSDLRDAMIVSVSFLPLSNVML